MCLSLPYCLYFGIHGDNRNPHENKLRWKDFLYSLNNNNNNNRNILIKHKHTYLILGIVSLQVNMCPLCCHQNQVYVRDYFLYRWKRILDQDKTWNKVHIFYRIVLILHFFKTIRVNLHMYSTSILWYSI
jgi:hypothetical protein